METYLNYQEMPILGTYSFSNIDLLPNYQVQYSELQQHGTPETRDF